MNSTRVEKRDLGDYGPLTQGQAENIADLAARRAMERLYAEIGRSVVKKVLWTLGIASAVFAAWMNGIFQNWHR